MTRSPESKDTFPMRVSHNVSCLSVMFNDDQVVADAGLAHVGVLSAKLGLMELA
jgi:hypothetical protein